MAKVKINAAETMGDIAKKTKTMITSIGMVDTPHAIRTKEQRKAVGKKRNVRLINTTMEKVMATQTRLEEKRALKNTRTGTIK